MSGMPRSRAERRGRLAPVLLLGMALPPTVLSAQSLAGLQVSGAWVTMTPGITCPGTGTADVQAQAVIDGPYSGRYDERGTLRLGINARTGLVTAQVTATFSINGTQARGVLEPRPEPETPLQVSCDPLTLRIDGTLAYRLDHPTRESGLVRVAYSASREVITNPYFGRMELRFEPMRPVH